MTSKSPRLMRFIKWGAGIVVVGLWIVIGLAAWAIGVRWPTVHRVDQPEIADQITLRADDYFSDSGYHISVHFRTCCTEKIICTAVSGYRQDSIVYNITPTSPVAVVLLRWGSASLCPYRIFALSVTRKSQPTSDDFFYLYQSEDGVAFPRGVDPDSIFRKSDLTQKEYRTSYYNFPSVNETLVIRRGK